MAKAVTRVLGVTMRASVAGVRVGAVESMVRSSGRTTTFHTVILPLERSFLLPSLTHEPYWRPRQAGLKFWTNSILELNRGGVAQPVEQRTPCVAGSSPTALTTLFPRLQAKNVLSVKAGATTVSLLKTSPGPARPQRRAARLSAVPR